MGIYTLTLIGLLFILVRENPFVMLKETPLDGQGLNPLLQDDWMVIHPPIMFVGYAAAAIPFAFAMAALWRRDYDGWAARAFPWALAGFLVLGMRHPDGRLLGLQDPGLGRLLGLGPGRERLADPLAARHGADPRPAHGAHQGRYRRANYVLAALAYLAVLYGTFLTRSRRARRLLGAQLRGPRHLGLADRADGRLLRPLGLAAGHPAAPMSRRGRTRTRSSPVARSWCSSTITMLISALVITFGTSAPLITRWFMENPAQVGPTWYNQVNLPIALLIALLLAVVPYLTWRGDDPEAMLRKLIAPLALRPGGDGGRGGLAGARALPPALRVPAVARPGHQPAQDGEPRAGGADSRRPAATWRTWASG